MPHLTDDQLTELRAELERQLGKLEKSMKVTDQASGIVELDQAAVGRLSRMDSLQSQSMAKNLAERERAKLALILQALARLENGSYGTCVECGGPVAHGRLLIFPETPSCTACG